MSSPKRLKDIDGTLSPLEESAHYFIQASTPQSTRSQHEHLREAITDLYLDVKIRSSDEIDQYDTEQFEKEREKLSQLSLMNIIEYIKASIEILMNMKLDENEHKITPSYIPSSKPYFKKGDKVAKLGETGKSYPSDFDPPKEYEEVIQKLEADVRTHIRVEQQLKLHIETVHGKLEEFERKCNQMEVEKREEIQRKEDEVKRLLGEGIEGF